MPRDLMKAVRICSSPVNLVCSAMVSMRSVVSSRRATLYINANRFHRFRGRAATRLRIDSCEVRELMCNASRQEDSDVHNPRGSASLSFQLIVTGVLMAVSALTPGYQGSVCSA